MNIRKKIARKLELYHKEWTSDNHSTYTDYLEHYFQRCVDEILSITDGRYSLEIVNNEAEMLLDRIDQKTITELVKPFKDDYGKTFSLSRYIRVAQRQLEKDQQDMLRAGFRKVAKE